MKTAAKEIGESLKAICHKGKGAYAVMAVTVHAGYINQLLAMIGVGQ